MAGGEVVVVSDYYEAKTFRFDEILGGVPVSIVVRAFVEDGKILAIRSARVLTPAAEPYPLAVDGKMTPAELEALSTPRQLRDSANGPWITEDK